MIGHSVRESTRSTRPARPVPGGELSSADLPVLFRFPSIAAPLGSASLDASTGPGDLGQAGRNSSPAFSNSSTSRVVASVHAAVQTLSGTSLAGAAMNGSSTASHALNPQSSGVLGEASATLSQQSSLSATQMAEAVKKVGRRLLNTLIVAIIIVALAIIGLVALRRPPVRPELANTLSDSASTPLGKLAELQLPEISAAAPARVQLGAPIPIGESSLNSFADSHSTSNPLGDSASMPLTTPRYETVSTPSAPSNTPTAKTSGQDTGGSPSLWDGADKSGNVPANVDSERPTYREGLILSNQAKSQAGSASAATQLDVSPKSSGHDSVASDSLIPTASEMESYRQTQRTDLPKGSDSAEPAKTSLAGDSANLGVTVGGGLTHPSNLGQAVGAVSSNVTTQTTATPDLDAAAISRKYVEHVQSKQAKLTSTSGGFPQPAPVNGQNGLTRPVLSTPASGIPVGQVPPASNLPNYGALKSAAQDVPYGTTGGTLTPYVRNAPGAQPSGLSGSNVSSNPSNFANSSGGGGYAIPPRGTNLPTLNANGSYVSSPTYPSTPSAVASPVPVGMIGQSGYATAPTGDVAGAPVPVTGRIGYATSTVGDNSIGPKTSGSSTK